MTLYSFMRGDGIEVERFFPMGECPNEIVCDDGVVARRRYSAPNISWGKGHLSPSVADRRNRDMRKRNEDAGKRMRERWKSLKRSDKTD